MCYRVINPVELYYIPSLKTTRAKSYMYLIFLSTTAHPRPPLSTPPIRQPYRYIRYFGFTCNWSSYKIIKDAPNYLLKIQLKHICKQNPWCNHWVFSLILPQLIVQWYVWYLRKYSDRIAWPCKTRVLRSGIVCSLCRVDLTKSLIRWLLF